MATAHYGTACVIGYRQLVKAGWQPSSSGLAGARANHAAFRAAWSALDAFIQPAPMDLAD
jgi:hypothetical protein